MSSCKKVAIITGGANGMGFAVSKALILKGDWIVNILDINPERGQEAAQEIGAAFHKVDVTNYSSLATTFQDIFSLNRRLDFVFANAGVFGANDFYNIHETGDTPPPPPATDVIDINLTSVMYTSYLAKHYFQQTQRDNIGPRSVVITASFAGLSEQLAGQEALQGHFGGTDGIRAILPGPVRTTLLPDTFANGIPAENFTPIEKIVDVVMMLLDADGRPTTGDKNKELFVGQTVEVFGQNHYFRTQHDFSEDGMAALFSTEWEY